MNVGSDLRGESSEIGNEIREKHFFSISEAVPRSDQGKFRSSGPSERIVLDHTESHSPG